MITINLPVKIVKFIYNYLKIINQNLCLPREFHQLKMGSFIGRFIFFDRMLLVILKLEEFL